MPYKIRIPKKKEAAPIRIASKSEKLFQTLFSNPKPILAFIAVVALITAGLYSMQSMNRRAEETAWEIETEASKLFHDPPPLPQPIEEGEEDSPLGLIDPEERLMRAAELYDEILDKYPKKGVAAIALFESGNVYYKLESYDLAEERFFSFIEKYPDRKALVDLSHIKLAYLYLTKGKRAEALSHFRTVYELPNSANKDQAGFELARALEADEKVDEAVAIYTDISSTFGESPWGTEAEVRLTLLNPPKPPEEISSDEGTASNGETSSDREIETDEIMKEEKTSETSAESTSDENSDKTKE